MRGKGTISHQLTGQCRITPAYAGKSTQILGNCFFDQDHPRLCGEKFDLISRIVISLGSPPPMRGKAAFVAFNIVTMRITPAYAGKREVGKLDQNNY